MKSYHQLSLRVIIEGGLHCVKLLQTLHPLDMEIGGGRFILLSQSCEFISDVREEIQASFLESYGLNKNKNCTCISATI